MLICCRLSENDREKFMRRLKHISKNLDSENGTNDSNQRFNGIDVYYFHFRVGSRTQMLVKSAVALLAESHWVSPSYRN